MQAVERLDVFEFPECPKKGSGLLTVSATVSVIALLLEWLGDRGSVWSFH